MWNVAVLGLGIMGQSIARRLLKARMPLTVYNRTPARAAALLAAGAQWADTPAEAAREANVVLSVVADDAASREVWLGDSGALSAMPAGSLAVECATLSPAWVRTLQAAANECGIYFLDAPLGGSPAMVEGGTLTLFVGATPEVLEQARPVLSAFAGSLVHFGPPGSGTLFKLVNNLLVAIQIAALGESVALAEALGLPMDKVGEVWMNSGVTSVVAKAKLPMMLARSYADAHFALQWMHKDVGYALQSAEAAGFRAPLGELVEAIYAAGLEQGRADLDFASVVETRRGR